MLGSISTARSMMKQTWKEHAKLSAPPNRSTAHPMTLPAGAVSNSAAREASSSRSTLVSTSAATVHPPRPTALLLAGSGAVHATVPGGGTSTTCPVSSPLLYMTNQIRFYPFSDRIDRFQMATITLATWEIGAAPHDHRHRSP